MIPAVSNALDQFDINNLARQCGLIQRTPKKIQPLHLLLALIKSGISACNSLASIAQNTAFIIKDTVSKQAIHKKINPRLVKFISSLLELVLLHQIQHCIKMPTTLFDYFKTVSLEDSTTISLPFKLARFFPGSKNKTGKNFASLKIQASIDILREKFLYFIITPFTKNDQSQAANILKHVSALSLIIRDLGYFSLNIFQQMIDTGVFFLSRLRSDVKLYNPESKKEFNLFKSLKSCGSLDINLLMGASHRIPVRLIAMPLKPEIAAERRRKAKNNRDKRLNPSKEYLLLLGWSILITNVPNNVWNAQNAVEAYSLRWRIEIIFKAWKSHFHIDQIHDVSKYMVEAYVYSMLLYIAFFQTHFYAYLSKLGQECKPSKQISLMKLAKFIQNNNFLSMIVVLDPDYIHQLTDFLFYYCTYEKRTKRKNYVEKLGPLS